MVVLSQSNVQLVVYLTDREMQMGAPSHRGSASGAQRLIRTS